MTENIDNQESGFSAVVQLTNLNDLLNSSNSCVKLPEEPKKLNTISLDDCLACAGCLSTEEQVIASNSQNLDVLKLKLNNKIDIVNIAVLSPQSVASFAAYWKIDYEKSIIRLASVLKLLGFKYVFDQNFGREISHKMLEKEMDDLFSAEAHQAKKPLIVSSCPGVVCYAEVNQPLLLSHLSSVPSPPLALAYYLKTQWAQKMEIDTQKIYLCVIAPCFDRKIEAFRQEYKFDAQEAQDSHHLKINYVDCVIGTNELLMLLNENNLEFYDQSNDVNISLLDNPFFKAHEHFLPNHGEGTSDGYLKCFESYMTAKYNQNSNNVNTNNERTTKNLYNSVDFEEISLNFKDAHEVIKCARVYGFRNLQILVQQIRLKKCKYDFVEAMACAQGCTNGGAQLRLGESQNVESILDKSEKPTQISEFVTQNFIQQFYPLKLEPKAVKKSLNIIDW